MKQLFDDYFKLFVRREGRVVLGKHWSSLWLLSAVLTVTFLAIAFSNASMKYLSDKMNDPFIRWMDIPNQNEGDIDGLASALSSQENMELFDYNGFQSDYYWAVMFFGADGNRIQYFRGRFFQDMQTDLMTAILNEENVVDHNCISDMTELPEDHLGVILTKDALTRLGYDRAPAFVDMQGFSDGADSLGFSVTDDGFGHIPIPVLGVVRRLPSNVDFVASKFLREQIDNDNTYPFNLAANVPYSHSLHYFVPATVDYDVFKEALRKTGESMMSVSPFLDEFSFYKPELTSFVKGDYVSLTGTSQFLPSMEVAAVARKINEEWADKGVQRVYDYNFSNYSIQEKAYLSVYFNSLTHVREFESFVNDGYHIKVDMSQVNAKENFNAVSVMAGILSWAIIVFAITCIILFIVNLLQSYFQKVQRNIGTFKAFGVSNRRLIGVYVLIVGCVILGAILIALSISFIAQGGLAAFGILKDGTYSYLSLWSLKTLLSIVIILVVSVATVYIVMERLLRQTPGDLIYDRQ